MAYAAKIGSSGGPGIESITVATGTGNAPGGASQANGLLTDDIVSKFKYVKLFNGTAQYANSWWSDVSWRYNVSINTWLEIAPIYNSFKASGKGGVCATWTNSGTYTTGITTCTYSIKNK